MQKEDKVHTTRFFLVDSISGVSASTSTSFNEQQNEESSETSNQGVRSKTNKNAKIRNQGLARALARQRHACKTFFAPCKSWKEKL